VRVLPYLWVTFLPLLGAGIVAVTGLFRERIVPHLAVGIGSVNAIFAALLVFVIRPGKSFSYPWLPGIADFSVVADGLGAFISVAAAFLGWLILVYSLRYMEHEEGKTRYYALVLLFIGAMTGLVLSGSLLTLYFFWETVGICSFSLIGFHYEDPKALKSAIKAFITTRIGDVGLISGILVLYFSTQPHTFDIGVILAGARDIPRGALAFASFAMLIGAIGKSAQMPLHVWLPDAMEAPTSVSALIHAATMVNAGVYLVARMYPAFSLVPGWTLAVTWVGTVTLLLSAFMAVAAKDIKRMLAYSTVSQLGYMFFAVGTGGLLASQFHLVSHAVFKALLFLSAGALIHEAGTRDMQELSGASKKMPVTGAMYLLGVMGLSGIPLFSGFFSKDMIFAHALEEGAYLPLSLAVIGAVLTFIYSWRSYFKVWRNEPSKVLSHAHESPLAMRWPLLVLGAGTLTSWLAIGIQSGSLEKNAHVQVQAIGPLSLVKETFESPAFLLSAFALAVGSLTVARYDRVMAWARKHLSGLLDAAFHGFYFDEFYLRLLSFAGRLGSGVARAVDKGIVLTGVMLDRSLSFLIKLTETFDAQIIEGFGRSLGKIVSWGSRKALEFDFQVIEGSGRRLFKAAKESGKRVQGLDMGDLNGNLVKLLMGIAIIVLIVIVEKGVWM